MIKAEFSASLLQSSVSHDPLEIILICWFAAKKHLLLLSPLKAVVLPYISVETFYFLRFFEYKAQKNSISNQIKSNHFYCHITTAQVPWWVKFLRACSKQCKKQKQFTYRQYIFTDCTEDNVQNTHTHTQYTQCTIKTVLVTIHYVHILHYVHI